MRESGDNSIGSQLFVLDTSSVINGYISSSENHYTVPEVVEEAKSLVAWASIRVSIDSGLLKVWHATKSNISLVESKLREIGGELSDTDVRILALALDLRQRGHEPVILTDDYGLQNMADLLDLEYSSVATRGIRSIFRWVKRCPGCGRECSRARRFCPVCGSKLRKVVIKGPL